MRLEYIYNSGDWPCDVCKTNDEHMVVKYTYQGGYEAEYWCPDCYFWAHPESDARHRYRVKLDNEMLDRSIERVAKQRPRRLDDTMVYEEDVWSPLLNSVGREDVDVE